MAQMNISSTLYNDTSEGVIAFAEQLRQQLINWNEYPHVIGELGQDRPNLQNDLNALFLSVYEKFLTFLNDADATSSAINTWKEIERFLADYADTGTLKDIVDQLNANIESRLSVVLENSTGSSTTNGMSQKAITDALGTKQDVISDLNTIRSGASAGATAYQKPVNGIPVSDLADVDDEPTAGSDNLVKSGGVAREIVWDVTARNSNVTFASLSALLSDVNLATLIPTAIRRGGMQIRFVQSSDNKYVQYRYMGTETTGSPNPFLDTANWQGVDNYLTFLSDNLIKSGSVFSALNNVSYEEISLTNYINGWIKSTGAIQEDSNFRSYYFPVSVNDVFKLRFGTFTSTQACAYAVYSAENIADIGVDNKVEIGPVGQADTDYFIHISNSDAKWLVIQERYAYNTLQYGAELSKVIYTDKFVKLQESISEFNYLNKYAYKFDGNNLFATYLEDNTEYVYWFKKCMFNQLFTFYIVAYREVDRNYPSCDGIETILSDENATIINRTQSDNIGPVSMVYGGFVGGNHSYNNDNVTKTAKTDSYSVFIDSKQLTVNSEGFCSAIAVVVNNIIYDPYNRGGITPPMEDDCLTQKLLDEIVTYTVCKNTIEVAVLHKYVNTTSNVINLYFGMQSVFNGTHYLTPNGEYTSWKVAINGDQFIKGNYPLFNRFIEKKNGSYQSSYLKKSFIGNHSLIANEHPIFSHSSKKSYHYIIRRTTSDPTFDPIPTLAGALYQWKGCYSFFKDAIVDENNTLVYRGVIDGKDAMFISTSEAKSAILIPIPSDLRLKEIFVVENNGFTNEFGNSNIEDGGAGLCLYCQSAASLIITFGDKKEDDTERELFRSKNWTISGNVVYDNNEIPQEYDITWADGVNGHVVLSNFNEDVYEYSTITATYQSITIVYTLTYDENGYIINETLNIQ